MRYNRLIARLLDANPSQIQGSIKIDTLPDITTDCLRFVTEFFDIISKSACHIYHSALQLTPKSSIVWKLYSQWISSPVARVVTGIPASWDSCIASAGTTEYVHCAVWSPCGQFIAAGFSKTIEVRNSDTLERVSILKPPGSMMNYSPHSLTFSPDGCLLACSYFW